jgi:hypothetical protein
MLEQFARLGYASKAVVYTIIGVLAILTAANRGGRITDTSGALRVVLRQPFGMILLGVLAVGLCGYAVWRFLDAASDPDRHGTSAAGLVTRIGNVLRGCIYGALGIEAFRLLAGARGSRGGEAELWTARILDLPFGVVIIVITGLIVAIYGATEVVGSIRGHVDPKLDLSSMGSRARSVVCRISRFGVGVRGGLLTTLGVLLVRAALNHDPGEAAGSQESMRRLAGAFDGSWFLGVIAAGVLAYAVDQAIHARYRRIRPVV